MELENNSTRDPNPVKEKSGDPPAGLSNKESNSDGGDDGQPGEANREDTLKKNRDVTVDSDSNFHSNSVASPDEASKEDPTKKKDGDSSHSGRNKRSKGDAKPDEAKEEEPTRKEGRGQANKDYPTKQKEDDAPDAEPNTNSKSDVKPDEDKKEDTVSKEDYWQTAIRLSQLLVPLDLQTSEDENDMEEEEPTKNHSKNAAQHDEAILLNHTKEDEVSDGQTNKKSKTANEVAVSTSQFLLPMPIESNAPDRTKDGTSEQHRQEDMMAIEVGPIPDGLKVNMEVIVSKNQTCPKDKKSKKMSDLCAAFVKQCFLDCDPPMDSPSEVEETIRMMEEDQVAEYRKKIQRSKTNKERGRWKQALGHHHRKVANCKQAHAENIRVFTQRFLVSTPATLVGLKHVEGKDGEDKSYIALCEYKGSRTGTNVHEELAVPAEWVEKMMRPGVSEFVSRLSESKTKKGFFAVPESKFHLDKRSVNKVKFIPARSVNGVIKYTADEARKKGISNQDGIYKKVYHKEKKPEEWVAMYSDGATGPVTMDDVIDTFGKPYMNLVKAGCGGGRTRKQKFYPIPPGSAPVGDKPWRPQLPEESRRHTCRYTQSEFDNSVFCGFSSALYNAGFCESAQMMYLARLEERFCKLMPLKALCAYVKESKHLTLVCEKLTGKFCLSELLGTTSEAIVIVVLEGTDGRRDQAVSIHNDLIFAGTEKFAMPLCVANLNYCCVDSVGEHVFKRFVTGYRFYARGKPKVPGKKSAWEKAKDKSSLRCHKRTFEQCMTGST